MNFENKKVLVLGLGITGVASVKALCKLGAKVTVNDMKTKEELEMFIDQLKNLDVNYELGTNEIETSEYDLVLKSPGMKMNLPVIKSAINNNVEVVTDMEIAARISDNKMIAITGTNGKTTTTSLIGDIYRKSGHKTRITGNIGVGILWELVNAEKKDVFVVETSSFQLDSTKTFKPKISVITNITPDHIDWHEGYENYVNAKLKIFKNQTSEDFTVLNYDDELLREVASKVNSKVIMFSREQKLEEGIFIEEDVIKFASNGKTQEIMNVEDIKMPGNHNIENVMAAIGVALADNLNMDEVKKVISEFQGVEHRLEFVANVNGVRYYNDSKGTNPDASIKAVEALKYPINIIAGGYDKGSDYTEFIASFKGKVKNMVLLGETADAIKAKAVEMGFESIHKVKDMKEAVEKCVEISETGDNVLLSPACASWGMYKNYEERGKDFKNNVHEIGMRSNEKKN